MNITRILSVATIVAILYSVQATAQIIGEAMRCVEKLMPCQPYIHSIIPPSPSCCIPMKEIVERDVTCLCDVFNHPGMLRLINLTKENALNLLTSCGANNDLSVCKTDSSASATALPGSTSNGSNSGSTKKNEALAASFVGFSFVSAFLGITFL
ncbi:Non-specific lipid transfer protein GPI-anchored 8 [Cardamine amara subsp. amara]|uniref:Non-specific lipid transfer protein GPI-anchored 8 n=1 Tax=Cardamine amara subsp. amara TaxID=228776 RepID=A0ABD1BDX1_CARAN